MKTNLARVRERHAVLAPPVPAKIIPFPAAARAPAARPAVSQASPPSLGVHIALALILVLACLLWEAMSMPQGALVDAGQTTITSPRAQLEPVCACPTRGFA